MIKTASKQLRVLIPNATSPKNPGDQAMLSVLIDLVKRAHPGAHIIVHTTDPQLNKDADITVRDTLYSWSVFDKRSILSRIVRVTQLLVQYILLRLNSNALLPNKKLSQMITDYKNADIIFFVGGGYLHSKKGFTQSLNLLMQLSLFEFAALFSSKKIVAPISVGPFGYIWHEKAVVHTLRKMDIVALREKFSFALVKKHNLNNSILASDHALMTMKKPFTKTAVRRKKIIVGFTMRKWLEGAQQTHLEQSVVWALERFALSTGASIQPIIQVDAPEYGEDDISITKSITTQLKRKKLDVLPTKKVKSVLDARTMYANLDLLLGMRMHSNIFAATQGTPFVAISYEYKTEGIAQQLSMEKYCISCEAIEPERLYKLLIDAYTNRNLLSRRLTQSIKTIQKKDIMRWSNYLLL